MTIINMLKQTWRKARKKGSSRGRTLEVDRNSELVHPRPSCLLTDSSEEAQQCILGGIPGIIVNAIRVCVEKPVLSCLPGSCELSKLGKGRHSNQPISGCLELEPTVAAGGGLERYMGIRHATLPIMGAARQGALSHSEPPSDRRQGCEVQTGDFRRESSHMAAFGYSKGRL